MCELTETQLRTQVKELCSKAKVAPPSPRQLANHGWLISMKNTCEAILHRRYETKILKRNIQLQADLFTPPKVDFKARAAGDY